MTVLILSRRYSERKWRKALASNTGVFKRIDVSPERYVGPHLTDRNAFVGDALVTEGAAFGYATKTQRRVFEQLEKQDLEKAYEYLLTICNAIEKWKEDIQVLQNFLELLKTEEVELEEEEKAIEHAEKIKLHFPDVLKRHFPAVFTRLEKDLGSIDNFLQDIESAIKSVGYLEGVIKDYFAELKAKGFGFLFE